MREYEHGAAVLQQKMASNQLPPRDPDIIQATQRLNNIRDTVENLACRLNGKADGLYGEQPPGKEAGMSARPVRSGALGSLEDRIDALEQASSFLARVVDRFDNLV